MLLCLDIFAVVVLGHIHKVLIHTAFSRFCSQMDGYMLFSFIFALAIIGQQTGEKLGLSEWEQQKWNWTMNDSWVIEENRVEIPEPMAQAFFFWTGVHVLIPIIFVFHSTRPWSWVPWERRKRKREAAEEQAARKTKEVRDKTEKTKKKADEADEEDSNLDSMTHVDRRRKSTYSTGTVPSQVPGSTEQMVETLVKQVQKLASENQQLVRAIDADRQARHSSPKRQLPSPAQLPPPELHQRYQGEGQRRMPQSALRVHAQAPRKGISPMRADTAPRQRPSTPPPQWVSDPRGYTPRDPALTFRL